jgi:branched-chain amino acid aminotransferase
MRKVVGTATGIVDPAAITAQHTRAALQERGLLREKASPGKCRYCVTADPARFARVSGFFLQTPVTPEEVEGIRLAPPPGSVMVRPEPCAASSEAGPGMLPVLSIDEHVSRLLETPRPGENNILAYYEHRLGAIAREPRLMLMPMDDHLAHRGDGVFETIKYHEGRLYRLDRHLERMRRSAGAIFLEPPASWERIRALVIDVAGAGREETGLMRVLLGRGPGGFGIDPAESPTASLYIVAYRFTPRPESWYKAGLKGFRTGIPAKQDYLAKIKNANYLPNVLMIREATDRGMDVPFCFDEEGFLAESAVASICLVNREGVLEVPSRNNALPGTTMLRALELLDGKVTHVMRRIREEDIFEAGEVIMLGTGPDCVAVSEYEGRPIGNGGEGRVAGLLRGLIRADMIASGVPVPGLA